MRMTRLLKPFALGAMLSFAIFGPVSAQQRENPFKNAKSWAFQLKNLEPAQQAKIAASPFDLVVIDSEQFPNGKETPLTRDEVEKMKKKPDGSKRLVIAYFSVGEAESYRYYWKQEWTRTKPSWVGKENKEWKENFLVKYWEPTWQNIIFGNPQAFADRVIAQGFDGFYIDRADAYYYFGDNADVRQKMRDFIVKLTTYMRAKKPDVAILVQNAEELLDNKAYVEAIDGIAKEDLLYGITHREEPNKKDDVDWSANLLKDAQKNGKKIFVIEYLTRLNYVADAKRRLDQMGFVMYTGPRGLAELREQPVISEAAAAAAAAAPPAKPSITERVKAKAKELLKKN
jgi:cysteinyl-tRNA synthetase, unknown class